MHSIRMRIDRGSSHLTGVGGRVSGGGRAGDCPIIPPEDTPR